MTFGIKGIKMKLDWLTEDAKTFLKDKYLREGETIEQRYQTIFDTCENICKEKGIADRLKDYVEKNWLSFATPVLRNFGADDNLSISCNKMEVQDSLDDILRGLHEVGIQAKYNAGTSVNFSNIRPQGSEISTGGISEGVMPFIEMYERVISGVNQCGNRRGAMAAYLSVDHPEILSFLDIGKDKSPIKTILPAVTVPEGWMESLKAGDLQKRKVWAEILKMRFEKQKPYILFLDNCNADKPKWFYDKNYEVTSSNLCSEIHGICNEDKSFACCLSSVNLLFFDDWKDNKQFIYDCVTFLNCVLDEYINQTEGVAGLEKSRNHAIKHRSIGLGVMGLHSYLQSKMIPFGSLIAKGLNDSVFKHIRDLAEVATKDLTRIWGECETTKGHGRVNDLVMAIAPTKSTGLLMGMHSIGIEPFKNNYHTKDSAGGSFSFKNPFLKKVLADKDQDVHEVWDSILDNSGSVQHLDFLTDNEKEVFKCFDEISQMDIVQCAAIRQKHIDQGQSLNLMFTPSTPIKDINKVILTAHELGVKALYYQYNSNSAQKSDISCSSCEG